MTDLKTPPNEIEIARLLNAEGMLPAGKGILRRLVYQRDRLNTAREHDEQGLIDAFTDEFGDLHYLSLVIKVIRNYYA